MGPCGLRSHHIYGGLVIKDLACMLVSHLAMSIWPFILENSNLLLYSIFITHSTSLPTNKTVHMAVAMKLLELRSWLSTSLLFAPGTTV